MRRSQENVYRILKGKQEHRTKISLDVQTLANRCVIYSHPITLRFLFHSQETFDMILASLELKPEFFTQLLTAAKVVDSDLGRPLR